VGHVAADSDADDVVKCDLVRGNMVTLHALLQQVAILELRLVEHGENLESQMRMCERSLLNLNGEKKYIMIILDQRAGNLLNLPQNGDKLGWVDLTLVLGN